MADRVDIVPIFGFQIKDIKIKSGKAEDDVGTMTITLEASKDELRAQDHDLNDMLGAMNMHSSTKEPIAIQVRF